MVYLLSGQSTKRKEFIDNMAQQHNLVPMHIYENDIIDRPLGDLVTTQTGLFGDREIYVLHELSRELDLNDLLADFAASDNYLVFSEKTITKALSKTFEKHDATIRDFGKEIEQKKQKFNMFSLTDALGERNKKKLWLLFQEARKEGSPEEIHGILFWQMKNLALVFSSDDNPGMNNFVYTKTKKHAENYRHDEIKKMARKMTSLFHNRDRFSTLDIELEKFILSL